MSARLHRWWLLVRGEDERMRKVGGLVELLRPYRGRVILMFVSLLFATGAALAPPPLAKLAIDEGILPGDLTTLTWVVVAFLVSALVYWGASYVQTYLVGWVGQRVLQDLRIQLFAHLQTLSVGFYSRRQAGVLILDDATSSVDATTEREIKAALREVMEGRTTFVIAHRLSTISLADEIVVLEDGEIVARGSHDELVESSPLYAEIAEGGLPEHNFLRQEFVEREAAGL